MINKTENEYLLVNLDTCFMDGSWEETTQPKRLKKYFNHILKTPFSYEKTLDILLQRGFKRGVDGKRRGIKIDSSFGACLLEEIIGKDKKLPKIHIAKLVSESRAI